MGLKVSDVERSQKFYSEILGLANTTKKPGHALIRLGSDVLILVEKAAGTSKFHFGFRLKDASQVDEWKKWLSSKGVPIYEDITEMDHPRSFKVRDPDGYLIEISSES